MKGWFWFIGIGLIAGWVGGLLMKGRRFGTRVNMIVGLIGAVFGGWLFDLLGLTAYGFTGALVMAVVGAVALLAFVGVVKRI